ncbi:SixA phosphatase family protein [Pseudidiomarina salinarum]|nr:histidine phosphatase family protein [Pseudidiomarina salinarum]
MMNSEPVQANAFTLYFARHAQKEKAPSNPGLNQQGQRSAQQLADILEYAGVEAVLSTDYNRTRETAQPLAERLKLQVETYPTGDNEAFIRRLLDQRKTVLVVGHSNTVPELVRLAGGQAPDLSERHYGDIFQLTYIDDTVLTTRLRIPTYATTD